MKQLYDEQSIFKKYLYNEVTLVIAIISIIIGVYSFIREPQVTSAEAIKAVNLRIDNTEKEYKEKIDNINTNMQKILDNNQKMQEDIVKIKTILCLTNNSKQCY